jgi:hypothetical protein
MGNAGGVFMYLTTVVLLMFVLPVAFTLHDQSSIHDLPSFVFAAGKWFVFWGAGVRLATAGLRQLLTPTFTAQQIFLTESPEVLPFVSELGVANLSLGTAGVLSGWRPSFQLPVALSAALFYGVAGLRHTRDTHRSFNQNVALVSDLFLAAVLIPFLIMAWNR